jgi:sulfatase maturation enzyme AslB (radical SAM superfamily)
MPRILLKTEDHSRDSAGMRYVYPVVSRRAGGVSVGINLNPNNACNWRCVYCQVPGLTRGGPPPIDLNLLERELNGFLVGAVSGDFMATRVPAGARRLVDVAFSGNGEPTSAAEFPGAVAIVERALVTFDLVGKVLIRLITNGSLLDRKSVQSASHASARPAAKYGSSSMPPRRRVWPASTAPAPAPKRWRGGSTAARRWRRPGCRPACSG